MTAAEKVYCEELSCTMSNYKVKPAVLAIGFLIRCEHCGTAMSPHRYKQLLKKAVGQS